MSSVRRKSHCMLTRLDVSLGLDLGTVDPATDTQSENEHTDQDCHSKVDPVQFNFTVPSPGRYRGIAFYKKPCKATVPRPFVFRTEERSLLSRSTTQNNSIDRSLPPPKSPSVLYRTPFYPKPTSRPPLVPISPELATKRRAEERSRFDEAIDQKRKALEFQLEQERREQEVREEREVKALRAQLVHKPNPIRHYQPVPQPRRVSPTVPRSPRFATKLRGL
ncbi:hypothetical protein CSKR_113266 [Clonorchis sinensis]|uniref:TPX2 C-terminal domain-containing protein n=1 Tax=Clonorchis sinensis TaxID=79923 RepID=A0A8T1M285_CLOSI|nr:hypothetical protein CSKR_113266 [Clonorchis sinensis]